MSMNRDFSQVEVATRRGQKARISLVGASGSGKTLSALEMAKVLTDDGDVLVIDTENKSAGLYADQFNGWLYNVYNWEPPFDPRELTKAIKHFQNIYDAIIIDSFSAFWNGEGGTLSIVEQHKSGRDSTSGWRVATPIQEEVVQTILRADCHMIVNVRAKVGVELEKDERGKVQVRKVPMQAVQRDNLIYEMTISANLDVDDHSMKIEKSRLSSVADKNFRVGQQREEFAMTLRNWLDSAEAETANTEMLEEAEAQLTSLREEPEVASVEQASDPSNAKKTINQDQVDEILALFGKFPEDLRSGIKQQWVDAVNVTHPRDLTVGALPEATQLLEEWLATASK